MNETKDISVSVKAKLKNIFKDSNLDYEDLLKHFVLKGALMFTVWKVKDRRITLVNLIFLLQR